MANPERRHNTSTSHRIKRINHHSQQVIMKIASHIAATLLGLAFIAFGLMFLLQLGPTPPPPPEGTPQAAFFAAFAPTGYFKLIKILEVVGGVLVLLPLTRNLGLLILGPILVNILAFHALIMKGEGLINPVTLLLTLAALFLLFSERKAFGALVSRRID